LRYIWVEKRGKAPAEMNGGKKGRKVSSQRRGTRAASTSKTDRRCFGGDFERLEHYWSIFRKRLRRRRRPVRRREEKAGGRKREVSPIGSKHLREAKLTEV